MRFTNKHSGIAGDIVISGSTALEHDQAFIKMFEATFKYNASLHSGTLQFTQPSLIFRVIT